MTISKSMMGCSEFLVILLSALYIIRFEISKKVAIHVYIIATNFHAKTFMQRTNAVTPVYAIILC